LSKKTRKGKNPRRVPPSLGRFKEEARPPPGNMEERRERPKRREIGAFLNLGLAKDGRGGDKDLIPSHQWAN